ncbi:cation diffusion facilitator family transporter [Sphingosinicella sp. BN140058]|uniref:cation diffusion facilitator family transporter n=1 Tax=Sphingosinicella sp. BN140058 TaxID=1892855 RepID=UPI0013EBBD3C|nr:cation diffusion facilitator family transporter [Sphingosinicella sp. BN140058]
MSEAGARESRLLGASLAVAVVVAIVTVSFGLVVGSQSILFDGIYTIVEAAMTSLSLVAARLIAKGADQRFQYGYWHLEPLIALISSLLLTFACLYGFLEGLNGIFTGGRPVDFDSAAIFYGVVTVFSAGFYLYLRRSGRRLGSQLLDLDARSWLVASILGTALGLGFLAGGLLAGTRWAWMVPYLDSAILTLVSVVLIPLPLRTILQVGREIMQIAPEDLDEQVRSVAREVAARHGFRRFNTHVRRSGRQRFVEIGLVAASQDAATTFRTLDRIRSEIAAALGGANPGCWLTVDFTAEDEWI